MFVVKYGSIIVMDKVGYAEALPLYGLRQNIFTDPQKPMKVAPGHLPHSTAPVPTDPSRADGRLRADLLPGLRRTRGAPRFP